MKIYKYITAVLVLVLGFTSCNDFDDLNTDPTTSSVASPETLISTVQVRYSGDRETTWRCQFGYHMTIMQMVSDGWTGAHGQTYLQDQSYFEHMWKASYLNINDLQIAIDAASTNPEQINYQAVARILKVMIFAQLTDTYGDIPYFQASKGYTDGIIKPAYDNQQAIYTDFFKELKEAVAQLDASKPFNGDLIYNGNVSKWEMFANSLRLRYAMRLINADAPLAQTEALAALSDGVMGSYMDAAYVEHGDYNVALAGATEIRGNAFSQLQHFPEEIVVACETYAGYMKDNNDPRLRMMFGMYGADATNAGTNEKFKSVTSTSIEVTDEYLAATGELTAFPPGFFLWDNTDAQGVTWTPVTVQKNGVDVVMTKYFKSLQINRELTSLDMPTMYMSYAEVELFRAEIASRGWGGSGISTAATHFSNAVFATVDELENVMGSRSVAGNVNQYITDIWATAATTSELEVINMQHYMANFYNSVEAFSNWRRSGFPMLKPANNSFTDPGILGAIPRKFPYPLSEMNFNRENLESHLNDGVNDWGAAMWWDGDATRGVDLN